MKNYVFTVFLACMALFAFAACGGGATTSTTTQPTATATPSPTPQPHIDGWLRVDSTGVRWLSWTTGGGQVNGLWSAATLDDKRQPSFTNGTLTGTQNGDQVSLNMRLGLEGITATGVINGNTLTLQTPGSDGNMQTVVYTGASLAAYTKALSDFKAKHPLTATPTP